MSSIAVQPLTLADYGRWDEFVTGNAAATFCHRAGWQRVIERAYGHRTHFAYAERDGAITGIVPLTEIRSRLFGHALISNAFCVYGGPVADDDASRQALTRYAIDMFDRSGAEHLAFRSVEPQGSDWAVKQGLYVTFRREISADHDKNLSAIPRKQRAVVRKGIANALSIRTGHDVRTLHRVYSESVRNLGTPVFPRRYFALLCEEFGDAAEILVVEDRGAPIAAVLSFYFRDEVLPYYGGGTPAARDRAGNDIMYWEVIAIGTANARATKLAVDAYGGPEFRLAEQNFARFADALTKIGQPIVPQFLMSGAQGTENSGGLIPTALLSSLFGRMMPDALEKLKEEAPQPKARASSQASMSAGATGDDAGKAAAPTAEASRSSGPSAPRPSASPAWKPQDMHVSFDAKGAPRT